MPRRRRGTTARPGRAEPSDGVARLVEHELGGLERSVLQLEIGAGRDSATSRAALRLAPGDYGHHREQGLGKLRTAVAELVRARVCEDHLESVTLAATGDPVAAAELAAGPARCRACAREAERVRTAVHQRLALTPAPLGPVAAAMGALKSLFGTTGTGAVAVKAAAAVVALTVVSGNAPVRLEERPAATAEERAVAPSAADPASALARPVDRAAGARRSNRPAAGRVRVRRRTSRLAPTAVVGSPVRREQPPRETAGEAAESVAGTVGTTVERVERTTRDLTRQSPVAPVVPPAVEELLEDAAGDVDGLLAAP